MNGYVGNPDSFKRRSSFRTLEGNGAAPSGRTGRWCSKHGFRSIWGKNSKTGEFYKRCFQGNKLNENCITGE